MGGGAAAAAAGVVVGVAAVAAAAAVVAVVSVVVAVVVHCAGNLVPLMCMVISFCNLVSLVILLVTLVILGGQEDAVIWQSWSSCPRLQLPCRPSFARCPVILHPPEAGQVGQDDV